MKKNAYLFIALILITVIFSCSRKNPVSPVVDTPTGTPFAGTVTLTHTMSMTAVNTITRTATITRTPTISAPVVTATFTPTDTVTIFLTTPTFSTTATLTATASITAPLSTATFTGTAIVSSSATATATITANITAQPTLNVSPQVTPVKIIFIHHSTGQNWLETGYGGLGIALNANNYYVSDTNYGWSDPGYDQGSSTDTVHWPQWFTDAVMLFVYAENGNSCYTNTIPEPSGENEIIMFKSCYPNSEVGSGIADEQAIYNGLLSYFAAHTDKLFVLIIPPPMQIISNPAKTRELANWLYNKSGGWLSGYAGNNVRVFDYYNVLTHADNHNMVISGYEQDIIGNTQNVLYYPSTDDHPSIEGQNKARDEFVPLLNAWYRGWKGI